jgi:tRNA-splicing ligase RtcB
VDDEDHVWVVIHSGSRGIGNQLARIHINAAKEQTRKRGYGLEDEDLAWLEEGTPEFDHYQADLFWAQRYALANREIMMDGALGVLFSHVGKGQEVERINCHHNYVSKEVHDGEEVWVTRKGAISAKEGELGIIAGSMANGCYVTRGVGNPLSFNTSSHGAGRRLSRGQAKRELDVESLNKAMEGRAWLKDDAESLLDEHPEAYKDLNQVMEDQADLTQPVTFLEAVLNFKGV